MSDLHVYTCELDLGHTYMAHCKPTLARECFEAAIVAATRLGRRDLAGKARWLLTECGRIT